MLTGIRPVLLDASKDVDLDDDDAQRSRSTKFNSGKMLPP
jgi:hypothetical protein